MSQTDKIDLATFKLIVETVLDARNAETLGAQLTSLLVGIMEIKGATLFIVNPVKEELEILATEGLSPEYKNKGPILVDKSITLESNIEPVIIEDVGKSNKLQYPEKAEREGIKSIVSFPLKMQGKVIGALRIYHYQAWAVTEQEISYLQILTKTLSMALKSFRLSSTILATRESLEEIHPIWL